MLFSRGLPDWQKKFQQLKKRFNYLNNFFHKFTNLFNRFSVHGCIFVYMPFIIPFQQYLHRLLSAVCLVFFSLLQSKGQTHKIFQSDIIYGGYTMGGAISVFAENLIKSKISIPSGSTIKKVYLFSAQDGTPNFFVPTRNVTINDSLFNHQEFTRFTGPFLSVWAPLNNVVFDESYMHVLDVTSRYHHVGDTVLVHIEATNHDVYKGYFNTYTIVIIFENPSLPKMGYTIVLNEQDVDHYLTYQVQFPHPIQNDKPVGFGIWGWHMCGSYQGDNSYIYINEQYVGEVGGEEPNAISWCSGVYPNFAYYNDSLFAFDGDTPDSILLNDDATANIQHYIPHLTTHIKIQSNEQTPNGGSISNPVGGLFFTYATPCDTFTATVQPGFMNHLCPGDTLQLSASGGIRYEWSPTVGLSCYDCPNPVFRHDSSMAYTVRIYQSDSCSKILPVKVNINYPRFDYSTRLGTCGLPNAKLIAHPLWPQRVAWYALDTIIQSDSVFTTYGGQYYQLTLTDTQGCSISKIVFVPETIPTIANFIVQPTQGDAPLDVNFQFNGVAATHFHWYFGDGDSLYNSTQPTAQHTYPFAGTYQPYLIAWLYAPHCTDTFYQQIIVHPALQVSQLLSPNNDGKNDTWIIQGIESFPNLAVKVFNRWGNEVFYASPYHNDWDGDKLPSATYFWMVYPLGFDQTPIEEIMKGYLELMR
jgi:gliding motility-associated-like protein